MDDFYWTTHTHTHNFWSQFFQYSNTFCFLCKTRKNSICFLCDFFAHLVFWHHIFFFKYIFARFKCDVTFLFIFLTWQLFGRNFMHPRCPRPWKCHIFQINAIIFGRVSFATEKFIFLFLKRQVCVHCPGCGCHGNNHYNNHMQFFGWSFCCRVIYFSIFFFAVLLLSFQSPRLFFYLDRFVFCTICVAMFIVVVVTLLYTFFLFWALVTKSKTASQINKIKCMPFS